MTRLNKEDCITRTINHWSDPTSEVAYEDNGCVYRGDQDSCSTRKCNHGLLFGDQRYHPSMENKTASQLFDGVEIMTHEGPLMTIPMKPLFADDVDGAFLNELQECHDSEASSGYGAQDEIKQRIIDNIIELARTHGIIVKQGYYVERA